VLGGSTTVGSRTIALSHFCFSYLASGSTISSKNLFPNLYLILFPRHQLWFRGWLPLVRTIQYYFSLLTEKRMLVLLYLPQLQVCVWELREELGKEAVKCKNILPDLSSAWSIKQHLPLRRNTNQYERCQYVMVLNTQSLIAAYSSLYRLDWEDTVKIESSRRRQLRRSWRPWSGDSEWRLSTGKGQVIAASRTTALTYTATHKVNQDDFRSKKKVEAKSSRHMIIPNPTDM